MRSDRDEEFRRDHNDGLDLYEWQTCDPCEGPADPDTSVGCEGGCGVICEACTRYVGDVFYCPACAKTRIPSAPIGEIPGKSLAEILVSLGCTGLNQRHDYLAFDWQAMEFYIEAGQLYGFYRQDVGILGEKIRRAWSERRIAEMDAVCKGSC